MRRSCWASPSSRPSSWSRNRATSASTRRARSFPRPRSGRQLMSRYLRLVLDAESAQRGFLLTEDPRYLRGFDPAVRALDPLLDRIIAELRASGLDGRRRQGPGPALHHRQESRARCRRRCGSMARSTAMRRFKLLEHRHRPARDDGLPASAARAFRPRDRAPRPKRARVPKRISRPRACCSVPLRFLSLLLVVLVGALLGRDMRRRERETEALGTRNRELDRSLQQRTIDALPPLEQPAEGGRAREGGARPRIAR